MRQTEQHALATVRQMILGHMIGDAQAALTARSDPEHHYGLNANEHEARVHACSDLLRAIHTTKTIVGVRHKLVEAISRAVSNCRYWQDRKATIRGEVAHRQADYLVAYTGAMRDVLESILCDVPDDNEIIPAHEVIAAEQADDVERQRRQLAEHNAQKEVV